MGALYLKDLADKTRRGLRGRVEAGRSGGGRCYGYEVVQRGDERGGRRIDPVEAEIVRRIFRDHAAGVSPRRIAAALNETGVPGPGGRAWGASTIHGNPKRGTGILNNELYVGRLVWNRLRYVKDPSTGRRVSRPNPPEDWIVKEVPELRIIEEVLWDAVKARQAASALPGRANRGAAMGGARRPRYLLSGLLQCGVCGGGMSVISASHVGCSTARNKGTCANRKTIARADLERRILGALSGRLMDPELFEVFCEEFTAETNRLRAAAGQAIAERAGVGEGDARSRQAGAGDPRRGAGGDGQGQDGGAGSAEGSPRGGAGARGDAAAHTPSAHGGDVPRRRQAISRRR
jgi:hypothetical protein